MKQEVKQCAIILSSYSSSNKFFLQLLKSILQWMNVNGPLPSAPVRTGSSWQRLLGRRHPSKTDLSLNPKSVVCFYTLGGHEHNALWDGKCQASQSLRLCKCAYMYSLWTYSMQPNPLAKHQQPHQSNSPLRTSRPMHNIWQIKRAGFRNQTWMAGGCDEWGGEELKLWITSECSMSACIIWIFDGSSVK